MSEMPSEKPPCHCLRRAIITALVIIAVGGLGTVAWLNQDAWVPPPMRNWNADQLAHMAEAPYAWGRPIRFAVYADNRERNYFSLGRPFYSILDELAARTDLAFIMHDGDAITHGHKLEFYQVVRAWRSHPFAARRMLMTVGNHEIRKGSDDNYRSMFGPLYYDFRVGSHAFISMNTANPKDFNDEQVAWLRDRLAAAQNAQTCVVFMHIPLFDVSKTQVSILDRDRVRTVLDLFKQYKVTLVIASHFHGWYAGDWEGVPYVVTGGAGVTLEKDPDDPTRPDPVHSFYHYLIVDLHDGKANVEVVRPKL
jgi:hypothetical protein